MALLNEGESRWLDLWQRLRMTGEPRPVFQDLVARYSERHRHYHTFDHIWDCLNELTAARRLAADPDAIELALWFHDAIYKPRASDNEEQSARLAQRALRSATLPGEFVQHVSDLILATRHQAAADDADARLLQDIDLSILGQDAGRFDQYETAIRQEYRWVPGKIFGEKRSAILKAFLDRPAIYVTPTFRDKYESAARANLARSIRKLNSSA